jgi:hypothetical protein
MIIQERAIIQVFWPKKVINAKFQCSEGLRFTPKIPSTMLLQRVKFLIFFITDRKYCLQSNAMMQFPLLSS